MRSLFKSALVFTTVLLFATLQGCSYILPGSSVSDKQKHQICEHIEHQLNFGDNRHEQNIPLTATQHANLLHQYRHYNCMETLNNDNQGQ